MAVAIQFTSRVSGGLPDVSSPFAGGAGQKVGQAIKDSVAEEFAGRFWKPPSGGKVAWKQPLVLPRDDGSTVADLGGSSGPFASMWRGASVKSSPVQVSVSVNAPGWYHVHRGGGTASRVGERNTQIRTGSQKMFFAVARRTGYFLPKILIGDPIIVPSRPHGTKNPELIQRIKRIIVASFAARSKRLAK